MGTECPKCHTDNPDDSKFCKECATPFPGAGGAVPTKTIETPFPQFKPGTSLANRYKIISELGKGGMGEVYLAEDTNLKRKVAVKVLPQPFALDKERLARFEREARLLASLNHPNIATIHGLEKANDQQFLVMELVDGETLAEMLKRGPLPVDETLEICRQIAEGLELAHEKGIIHRDLKPANIKITPEGKVKILDFGIAKTFRDQSDDTDSSKSPTITDEMTEPGMIIGTAAYMSPEQAKGKAVDKRTDIWAFGCILFECLTGKRVFGGETTSDTIASILKGEPEWTKLPSKTPTRFRILLRRCLQKDSKKRLHDMADVRIEMDESESSLTEEAPGAHRFSWRRNLPIISVCILIGVFFGFLVKRTGPGSISHTLVVSVIKTELDYALAPMTASASFGWPSRTAFVISKDGSFIIYCAEQNNATSDTISQLFMRRLREKTATPIPGTEGGIAPFLSPDNSEIGFWADKKLKKIPIDGGIAQDLCEAASAFGASWGDDEKIVFASSSWSGLYSIPSSGGKPKILTEPDPEKMEDSHRLPFHLPNGKGILFTIRNSQLERRYNIAILDSESGSWRVLLDNGSDARYISTGHILFLRQGTLMAVPFDLDKPGDLGQPVTVIPDIIHMTIAFASNVSTAAGQFSISESGSLIYVSGGTVPDMKNLLVWVDFEGNEEPLNSQIMHYFAPRLSPNGENILYKTLGTEQNIGIYDIDRDIHTTLITEGDNGYPIFSPTNNAIVFSRQLSSDHSDIFIKAASGDTKIKQLITSPYNKHASSFSPEGNLMAYLEYKNRNDILIYDFRDNSSTPFAASEFNETYPDFSPNGRWIAYCTDEEGHNEVYVRNSSGLGEAIKVSRDGGMAPLWARSGKKLFYIASKMRQVWVSDVLSETSLSFGKPILLFGREKVIGASGPVRGYDISLDDKRFLAIRREDRQPQPVIEINLIQNWFEELERLVPTSRK
ncbi:protein kinase [Acidobacteriota bacterium]